MALICADIKADVDGLGNLGAWIAIHEARKKQLQESIEINQEFIDHFDKNFQPFMDTYSCCCRALARARLARRTHCRHDALTPTQRRVLGTIIS